MAALNTLTHRLTTFHIFHRFSMVPLATKNRIKSLDISSFKLDFDDFYIYNHYTISLHFIPAVGTTGEQIKIVGD